jgi:salicylate hydroxylase
MVKKTLIIGGGIGGLAAALACSREGTSIELFERAPAFTEVGAGVQLGPNVVKILHAWGLKDALAGVASFPERLQVRSAQSGVELGVLRLGSVALERYGSPYATVHRADLQALLLHAVEQQTPTTLHLDSAVTGFEQQADGVSLQTADGREAHGSLLVGADGLWSQVRRQLLGDIAPIATGHLAYRAMVPQHSLPEHLRSQQITAWLGPNLHVVQYPVRRGLWMNVVAIVHGRIQGDPQNWDHSANAADLQGYMAQTYPHLQDLIGAIAQWRLWGLNIRPPMRNAGEQAQGRVALLGDAAHPMLPYLAQGAGMAIEDANCLGLAVGHSGLELPAALKHYAASRWQRNARVQAGAIRNGKIFHATGLVRWGRDTAMKLLGESLLDMPWLYRGT